MSDILGKIFGGKDKSDKSQRGSEVRTEGKKDSQTNSKWPEFCTFFIVLFIINE